MDRGIQALAGSRLTGGEQLDSILVLTSHVRNLAQQTITHRSDRGRHRSPLAGILTTEAARFPSLAAAMRDRGGRVRTRASSSASTASSTASNS